MAQLEFLTGQQPMFVFELREGRLRIGRADSCDLALPSTALSRIHCTITGGPTGFVLVDRSSNGTAVNGATLDGPRKLVDGDEITLGPYRAVFLAAPRASNTSRDQTQQLADLDHELLIEADEDHFAVGTSQMRFTAGPRAGEVIPLQQARTALGGPDADVALAPDWPRGGLYVRLPRGRALLEPGQVPCILNDRGLREMIPFRTGDQVRMGEHVFAIEHVVTEHEPPEIESLGELVATSSAMRKLFGVMQRMARSREPLLLTGESGTGKEVSARACHEVSPRADGPFVALNSAGLSEHLLESQLFGHEKGAFTGATERTDGAFQRADGGTLLLDEIGELRIDLQAKLLRALQSGEVTRLGGAEPEFPDVRVIAATNRDLLQMIREKTFREDLYFRLCVLTVQLPALRERREDIPLLAETLIHNSNPDASLAPDALEMLQRHSWPGNVRELRNVLIRALCMAAPEVRLGARHLEFMPAVADEEGEAPPPPTAVDSREMRASRVLIERRRILAAYEKAEKNERETARALGMKRSTLKYRLRKYGVKASAAA